MKRRAFWILWALAPVVVVALHYGPGQRMLARDDSRVHIRLAGLATTGEDWQKAIDELELARNALPTDDLDARTRIDLAAAKAKLESGDLLGASSDLDAMLDREIASDHPRQAVIDELRATTAESSYYTAWVMRLEGATEEEWKPETEKARQNYRLLAESGVDDARVEDAKKNLEAVIRLEQMDLNELKARPLPKKCNCKSGCCQKKREQRLSQCKGNGKKPSDNRKEINSNSASDAVNHGKGS
ncbi:MAG: hypothetical protein IT438_02175 [Phycisphaerales bacterium]|nr:hypothetical protein [Phycisphaerales bacterium]